MLVISLEGKFFRKAVGRTFFNCEDGALFAGAVSETVATGEVRTVQALTTGRNDQGETVAEFW